MGGLPPVFIEFLGSSKGVKTAMADVKGELATADAAGAGSFKKTGMLGKAAIAGIGLAAADVAVKTVKMAGDFQVQMTRVRTGAGEAASNMKTVGQGVLAMAGQVGESTTDLTQGLYTIESAGYHGADALTVLKTSAQGARTGAADLQTTTDATTTALNAYGMGASKTTEVMNALIATEGEGKTNLEALAGSMSTVLPTAASAKIGLNEVLGAMATMTAQGTPAKQAATYLRQTIGQLANPSAKAANEMQNLGLSAVKVGQEMGTKGLAATLTTITDAIEKHMGPAGTVLIQKLQGASANTSQFQRALADLPPTQQTYIGALATMVGGTKSMQAALELTGPHMATFQKNVDGVNEHVKQGGKQVEGWAEVQKNLNQKIAEAKASMESLGIQIGQYLMPAAQAIIGVIAKMASFFAKHTAAAKALAIAIGVVLVAALVSLTVALWNAAAAAWATGIPEIVIGITLLIAAVVLLAMHWRQVWGEVKRIASDVGNFVSGVWHSVASWTTGTWHSITSSITGAWHSVASFFTSAWHTVTDPIVGAWHWVQHTTSTVWNAISGFFRKWWPLLLVIFMPAVALVMSLWNHFHTQIEGTAKKVWNAVKSFFKTTWNWIKTTASTVWGAIKDHIVDPVTSAWHRLETIWQAIKTVASKEWNSIKSTASSVWGRIKSAIESPLNSAYRTVSSTASRIKTAVSKAISGAYNSVKNEASHFASVGRDIISGMVNGIEGGISRVTSAARHAASSALSAAKNFLGINSPSRAFAEIGDFSGQGFAQGLTTGTRHAVTAARGMASAVAGAAVPRLPAYGIPGLTGSAAAAGAGQMAQVNVTVKLDSGVLFKSMQQQALLYERNNTSNGLSLKATA
jgi:TP901 family phage tail tape measure protein